MYSTRAYVEPVANIAFVLHEETLIQSPLPGSCSSFRPVSMADDTVN